VGHVPEDSDTHSEKKNLILKRVKIVIRDKLFVSHTDNAYILYVGQLNVSGDLHKVEQKTPCKNTKAVSLIVKT